MPNGGGGRPDGGLLLGDGQVQGHAGIKNQVFYAVENGKLAPGMHVAFQNDVLKLTYPNISLPIANLLR